jgi:hypothetical protein
VLYTAYFAEQVATFAIVMGVALLLAGLGFGVLTLRALKPAENREGTAPRRARLRWLPSEPVAPPGDPAAPPKGAGGGCRQATHPTPRVAPAEFHDRLADRPRRRPRPQLLRRRVGCVDAGARHRGGDPRLPTGASICRAAGVPCVAVHDRDAPVGRRPRVSERIWNRQLREIAGPEHTIVVEPDFEGLSHLVRSGLDGNPGWR